MENFFRVHSKKKRVQEQSLFALNAIIFLFLVLTLSYHFLRKNHKFIILVAFKEPVERSGLRVEAGEKEGMVKWW